MVGHKLGEFEQRNATYSKKEKRNRMGQKVHPTGLRLGISNNWSSKWNFDPKQNKNSSYREMLQLDLEIQRILRQIFKSSKAFLAKVAIHKSPNLNVYDIYISAFLPRERYAFKADKLKLNSLHR